MKRIGLFIAFLAILAFVLPSLTAQDAKKDADKTDKKDADKKDTDKTDKKDADKKDKKDSDKTDKKDADKKDKKDADKTDPEKKADSKKVPEKLVYGAKFITKIISMGGESSREFTIELHEPDPQKVFEYNKWRAERSFALSRQQAQALMQQNPNTRFQQLAAYQRDLATFQVDAAKRGSNLTSAKPVEVRAAENAKVRTLLPPVEFDELGFQKKWTKKELEERKDKTGLPGFAVDFDALKSGQYVEIYMVKQTPMKKTASKKKGPDDDDPPVAGKTAQEFVLIVIRAEGGK